MKKLFILSLVLLSLCSSAFAERKVYCEIESPTEVTYYIRSMNSGWGFKFYKYFVKLTNEQNQNQYWFRIATSSFDRFLYYMDIQVDGKTFRLYQIKNLTLTHEQATNGQYAQTFNEGYAIYDVPENVINEIKKAKQPITLIIHKQNRLNITLKSDLDFTQKIQDVINTTYNQKDELWKPSVNEAKK